MVYVRQLSFVHFTGFNGFLSCRWTAPLGHLSPPSSFSCPAALQLLLWQLLPSSHRLSNSSRKCLRLPLPAANLITTRCVANIKMFSWLEETFFLSPATKWQIAVFTQTFVLCLHHQVQNLAMRGVSGPKGVGVKTEAPERSDSGRKERREIEHINELWLCMMMEPVVDLAKSAEAYT